MRLTGRPGTAVAGVVGLCLGLLALGPGIAPGYVLSYDMVFVPSPAFTAALAGLGGTVPRAVPSDAVVAALAVVLPADLVQKLLLLGIFTLACAGAAALLAGEPFAARITAGVCFAWNPFVGERLILGQWALLLGYAGLPWVLVALAKPGMGGWRLAGRLAFALLPAAVGGFAAMSVSGLVAVPAAGLEAERSTGRRLTGRLAWLRVLIALAVLGVLSLPWLIPSLSQAVHTSGAGVGAFAARADTPFGSLGSLLMLGGAWNSQTVPYGYGGAASAIWLAVVAVALAGFAAFGWRRWPGLAAGAAAGLVIACLGITGAGAGLLRAMIGAWPGFAVLRDGQQFIAPLALAEAIGLGLGVAWLLRRGSAAGRQEPAGRAAGAGEHQAAGREEPAGRAAGAGEHQAARLADVRWLGVISAVVAPVVLLPGLAWGAAGRLHSVQYPADWLAARRLIDRDLAGGSVLVLPWGAYRRLRWNHDEAMLDPWPRLVNREVIWNDAVRVGRITVPAESPQARALTARITSGGALTGALRAAGVRYVIVDAGFAVAADPGARRSLPFQRRLGGAQVVLSGPGLVVYRLPPANPARADTGAALEQHVAQSNELTQFRDAYSPRSEHRCTLPTSISALRSPLWCGYWSR